jgi:hypothetical protein
MHERATREIREMDIAGLYVREGGRNISGQLLSRGRHGGFRAAVGLRA